MGDELDELDGNKIVTILRTGVAAPATGLKA
jgi:hypothetical protein